MIGKCVSDEKEEAWSIPEISLLRYPSLLGEYRLRRKARVNEIGF